MCLPDEEDTITKEWTREHQGCDCAAPPVMTPEGMECSVCGAVYSTNE